jgi:defect-in-organelle-trafficking protein DotA
VNVVDKQKNSTSSELSIDLPNFPAESPYYPLNGICGQLKWNAFPADKITLVQKEITSMNKNELETAKLSRAIAIQQMYIDLSMVAQSMVRNNPGTFSQNQDTTNNTDFSDVAVQQFGVPQSVNGNICDSKATEKCILWGSVEGAQTSPLFNGTEFRGAILDYNGIMLPTLTLIKQASQVESSTRAREFIRDASAQGWIMAGSYFFNLISLNVKASEHGALIDENTGLNKSTFSIDPFKKAFTNWESNPPKCSTDNYGTLCTWFNSDPEPVQSILKLINNYTPAGNGTINTPDFEKADLPVINRQASSTVFGFTNNSTVLQLPNQPGFEKLKFADSMNIKYDASLQPLPSLNFNCGEFRIWGLSAGCLGRNFAEIFYNGAFVPIYNFFLKIFGEMITSVIQAFLVIPLVGMSEIFKKGMKIINEPGVNPIVALAQMGTYYINFAANLWLELIMKSITSILIPIFGMFIMALIAMSLPLLLAWLGIMVAIGFNTAYYVPIMPYMVFTFGAIGWLMSVIESMVAAPIVALAVTHPEGHDAFGKGETAIMILLNVFLRPSMMIIGYIAAIALSYVSVWIINAGFDNAIGFIQGGGYYGTGDDAEAISTAIGGVQGGYKDWAGIFAYFFSILVYTMIYITVVTKAFTLIAVLPDKVLRWVGGSPESYGQDTSQWGDETKQKVDKSSEDTTKALGQVNDKLGAHAGNAIAKVTGKKTGDSHLDAS